MAFMSIEKNSYEHSMNIKMCLIFLKYARTFYTSYKKKKEMIIVGLACGPRIGPAELCGLSRTEYGLSAEGA